MPHLEEDDLLFHTRISDPIQEGALNCRGRMHTWMLYEDDLIHPGIYGPNYEENRRSLFTWMESPTRVPPIYKGVRQICPPGGKWIAKLGNQIIGVLDTEGALALAYDRAAFQVPGSRADLNFPDVLMEGSSTSRDHVINIVQLEEEQDILQLEEEQYILQLEEEQGRWKKLGKRLRSRIKRLPKELYLALLPVAGQFLYQNVSSPAQDAITNNILVLGNGLGFLLLLGGMLGLARRWKHAYLLTLFGLLFSAAGVNFSLSVGITGALAWAARAVGLVGFLAVVAALIC